MLNPKIFEQIKENISEVIAKSSGLGQDLFNTLIELHPADIAQFLTDIKKEDGLALYLALPVNIKISVFEYFSDTMQASVLKKLPDNEKLKLLENIPLHEVVDFLDLLSDQDVKDLFKIMHTKDRKQVLELMKFGQESAGGIMETDVITFTQDLTVEKAIQILQKVQPKKEVHQDIYVTDKDNKLVGHIKLEDLVLKNPKTHLYSFLRENKFIAHVDDDQEEVSQKMVHYHLSSIPVVAKDNYFVGVIPTETLIDVIEEESSEDIYKISAMAPIKQTYFETPFFRLLTERSVILIGLMLIESLSSAILHSYDTILAAFYLTAFVTMVLNAGGTTSSQSSILAIQGLTSGEINFANVSRFVKREFLMSIAIAAILGITAFLRVYLGGYSALVSLAVALAIACIVTLSTLLGSLLPIILKKFKIDPAFSAGPVLATIMDILGSLLFCVIAKLILS